MIDLHTHSTCSDGTLSPEQLVDCAVEAGISHLALTDHDTIAGLADAESHSRARGLAFIPGVEISVAEPRAHILGYGIDRDSAAVRSTLSRVARARDERNPKIIAKLNELGYPITIEQVIEASGGEIVGRPHIARVLVDSGYIGSVAEAFDQLLASGRPAYVGRERISAEEAIRVIRSSGGVAVLAHPGLLSDSRETILSTVTELQGYGLIGIEAMYPDHTAAMAEWLIHLAGEYGLIWTGGTDFHGANKPGIGLGVGRGNLEVPAFVALSLMEAIGKARRCLS